MLTILRLLTILCAATLLGSAQPPHQAVFRILYESGAGQATSDRQPRAVSIPVLGFVVDDSGGLRPFIGVPGSASIGRALDLGFQVTRAHVSPMHDYILATVNEGEWPVLLQVRGDTITVRSSSILTGQQQEQLACEWADPPSSRRRKLVCSAAPGIDKTAKIDRIALSPTGSAAALLSESQQRIYAFNNLSHMPALLGHYELGQLGPLSAIGISDDGKTVVVGVSNGDTGSLFLANLGRPPRLIATMRRPSSITFLHSSDTAVIADDVENKIYALSNGRVFTVATAENGISGPIAVAVSKDNRIFAGNMQTGSVTTIGPNRILSEPLYCNCTLTGLHPTNADAVFRLTDFSGGPVLLFDASGPRTVFVPASSHF